MIDPRAIDKFLKEPRDSHVWIKSLSRRQLLDALDEVGFVSFGCHRLDTHQLACILLGIAHPQFCFWLDMGTGKSLIVLELLSHFWRAGLLHRGVVLCASEDAVGGWRDEIEKWKWDVPFACIGNATSEEKWQTLAEMGAGVFFCPYPGLNWMFSSKGRDKKKGKTRLKPDPKRIGAFAKHLQAIVWDESPHVGHHNSLQFKISKRISEYCPIRIAQAGVPFGRDPVLAWAQHFLVDRGISLGPTLGLFRSAFYKEKRAWFGGFDYTFRKDMEPELTRVMQHRSISYSFEECGDLPPVVPIIRKVRLSCEAMDYFHRAMESLKAARGDRKEIENLFLRMRQLSSGFIGYTDDETGERAKLVLPVNAKLDDLVEVVGGVHPGCKFVIFYEFTWSGQQIVEVLKKRLGLNVGWIWSGAKNRETIKRRFDTDDRMAGLCINHRIGAESLNLQVANYLLVYESPVGVIARKQMERRCFRKGQTKKGFQIDFVATRTDARILDFHREGGDLFTALIRDPMRALGGGPRTP